MKTENFAAQTARNQALLEQCLYMKDVVESQVVPFELDFSAEELTNSQISAMQALEIDAARVAIAAVGSLSKLNEVDHLGGGLDLIPALNMTLAMVDHQKVDYTIENAHTSAGYYGELAALGYLDDQVVINQFRRSLDIPGHVSWVPGGTQLNGGRLGVMVPTAVGQALARKARYGKDALVFCHCGDAGWISGQALNGFNAADVHDAPVVFIMHRNGIQLSGTTRQIMDKDPRPIVEAMGVKIIETASIHDTAGLYRTYREAIALAREGRPSMIYPTGYADVDLNWLGEQYGISAAVQAFAERNGVALDTNIWVPGALMSYRDLDSMLECIFAVNNLPGGKTHHDGHLKGRDVAEVLANPMLQYSQAQQQALDALRNAPQKTVITTARPPAGSANLVLSDDIAAQVKLPDVGVSVSPRAGVQVAYGIVAETFPDDMFVIDCDLAPSTKVDKARAALDADHQFEMSIEEQVSTMMANGIAMATNDPQLVVFATFAAFFEGIAREGFEMWRYQRNLNGANEGLNVTFHLSHVGACTGRDHFSGWALDWINIGLSYLPYLHRFYAPADARAAFVAIRDLAAAYGGHIIGIPRDNLPVLSKQDGSGPLWEATDAWEPTTAFRTYAGARKAILVMGAPAFLADEAATELDSNGIPCDVYIINGLPLAEGFMSEIFAKYPEGVVSIEDGLIGTAASGLSGFAGLVATASVGTDVPIDHIGIVDPCIAPSEGHMEVWEHFGITAAALVKAVKEI